MSTNQQPKRSFFERLTGSIRMQDDDEQVVIAQPKKANLYANRYEQEYEEDDTSTASVAIVAQESDEDDEGEAQLAVDVYETNTEIIIKTMTAGVKKEDLQIHVSRESVTIKGRRDNERAYQHTYVQQELYWGPFSRTIKLPDEVDIEQASATEHHGLITIKLPKFDKKRQATLKVM